MQSPDVWNWLSSLKPAQKWRPFVFGGRGYFGRVIAVCGVLFSCFSTVQLAHAKDWGLVVGVNDYKHFPPFTIPAPKHFDLQGAVNDAKMIAEAMQKAGVDLPASRFLLDQNATLSNFLTAWEEMKKQASPGDTLIVTFAGHGAREKEVAAPFDEPVDHKDETIMFHEFDPENPRIGRLNDDQLSDMLANASQYKIIWVMDSCHSAGLNRSTVLSERPVITRNGGTWDIPITPLVDEIKTEHGDEGNRQAHVTYVLATSSEDKQVTEVVVNGQSHGALSVYFSKALQGAGDSNQDGIVTRGELSSYLQDRVFSETNQQQQPRLLPRGDGDPVWFHKGKLTTAAEVIDAGKVRVIFETPAPPQLGLDLANANYEQVAHSPDLIFKQTNPQEQLGPWQVFNQSGDEIRRLANISTADFAEDVNAQIVRIELLRALRQAKKDDLPPIEISAGHENKTQPVGAFVSFSFKAPGDDLPFLTLFNVASNGIVQNLYPAQQSDDGRVVGNGFSVKFKVTPPTGADQLVAVFCRRPPLDLRAVLAEHDGSALPDPSAVTDILARTACQVNVTGLFTSAS